MAKTVKDMFKDCKKRLDAKLQAGQPHAQEIKEYAILQGLSDQYGPDAEEQYITGVYYQMMSNENFNNISSDEEKRILDGSNYFYYTKKYPSMDDMFKHMSSNAFLDFESRAERADRINSKEKEIAQDNRNVFSDLERELDKLPADEKKGEGFQELAKAVHNMTLYGTYKFTKNTFDDKRNVIDSVTTDEISRSALFSGIQTVYEVANNVKDISPKARDMVQSCIWRQNMKNAKYLENTPLTEAGKKKLAEERKSREAKLKEGEKLELSAEKADKDFDKRKFNFLKKGGTVINAIKKYNKATLIGRGKSEYANIGAVISDFEKKIGNYTELYRADTPKKPVDPQRINDHAKELLKSLNELKKANAAYFEHKRQDGQWRRGTNSNADKRIDAVRSLDEMADSLTEFLQEEIKRNEAKLEKAKQKNQKKEAPKKEEPKKEAPKKEEMVNIFGEAAKAQATLKKAGKEAAKNGKYPDKNEYTRELAIITTAAMSNTLGDEAVIIVPKTDFESGIATVMGDNDFNLMLLNNNDETLFKHATEDMGQKLINDLSGGREANKKFEEIKADNAINRSNNLTADNKKMENNINAPTMGNRK